MCDWPPPSPQGSSECRALDCTLPCCLAATRCYSDEAQDRTPPAPWHLCHNCQSTEENKRTFSETVLSNRYQSLTSHTDMCNVPTGPQGDVLHVIHGLWGQVKVLRGLLETAWQWKGLRGRLLWELTHWTSRYLLPTAAQLSGHLENDAMQWMHNPLCRMDK